MYRWTASDSIETTAQIVECFDGEPLAQNCIIDFTDDNFPVDLRTAASRLMTLLFRDEPISAVNPFSVIANLREKISTLKVQTNLFIVLDQNLIIYLTSLSSHISLYVYVISFFI